MKKSLQQLSTVLLVLALSIISYSQEAGPSSSQTPYVLPVTSGIRTKAILTVPDNINGYKMCGIPDGLGAFDNADGTFTLLVNHEMANTAGIARAHGSTGAFISKWIINKSDLKVISGTDLIKNVKLWNGKSYDTYNAANPNNNARFFRFCSADLPAISAFYNEASGKGTRERIFMNGEESGTEGRAFAHIVTGVEAGTSYELPYLGKFSWENAIANPATGDLTVVAGTDDATTGGQVYFYIGAKSSTGNDIERAGLSNGKVYSIKIEGMSQEVSASIPKAGTSFSLIDLGRVDTINGNTLNSRTINSGATSFLRPEDGTWDPTHPQDFYFVTTNAFDAPSRLWQVHFKNINDLKQGGTITALLDGTEGQKMFDNITMDSYGHLILQEDVGNNPHNGKIWQYTVATDELKLIGMHDQARFGDIGKSTTAPFNQDEETSGVIDVQSILGAGMFLLVDQAHYSIPGEVVEGGQILALYNPDTYASNLTTKFLPYWKTALTYSVNAFPNPTVDGLVTIKGNAVFSVLDVYSFSGTSLSITAPPARETKINLSGQPAGAYVIKVNQSNIIKTISVIKN
jgi:hypothetical protein